MAPSSIRIHALLFCWAQLLDVAGAFSAISPLHSPEDVVRRQLDAFQKSNVEEAFQYGSEENQVMCGPTWEEFNDMLLSEPAFAPIIGHKKSSILMTVSTEDWGMCCLVRMVPSSKLGQRSCLEYWWELTKRQKGDENEGCWMIDSILPDFEDLSLVSFEEDDDDVYYDTLDMYEE